MHINIFYSVYKYYQTICRLRKILPTSEEFEIKLKYKCKNAILTNPTNKDLTDNLLPLWIEHELSLNDTLKLLNEVERRGMKSLTNELYYWRPNYTQTNVFQKLHADLITRLIENTEE